MKKLLVSIAIASIAQPLCAQEAGFAWFVTKGHSEPVILAPAFRVEDLLGNPTLDIDASLMLRPLDGIRLGGSLTISRMIATNLRGTIGIGGLASDVLTWSSIRPGLVLGVTAILGRSTVATVSLNGGSPSVMLAVRF